MKAQYNASVAKYTASKGQLLAIDEVTGDHINLISQEGAQKLRSAALLANQVPYAVLDPVGLGFFVLESGERAVVPIIWQNPSCNAITECSTHPDAPDGLQVLPGICDSSTSQMSIVVENESPLSITVTERDMIAAGANEEELPTLDTCTAIQAQQERFINALDWSGAGHDEERIVSSPDSEKLVVVKVHKVLSLIHI